MICGRTDYCLTHVVYATKPAIDAAIV